MLMLHGERRSALPVRGQPRVPRRRCACRGARSRSYPGLRHEIFNEPERETVYRDLLAWLQATLRAAPRDARGGRRMSASERLTHLDEQGRARMVDVGAKAITRARVRGARRGAHEAETLARDRRGPRRRRATCSRPRASPGSRRRSARREWIPLAHAIPLDAVEVRFEPAPDGGEARPRDRGARRARRRAPASRWRRSSRSRRPRLTVYDMCKAVDRGHARSRRSGWSRSAAGRAGSGEGA